MKKNFFLLKRTTALLSLLAVLGTVTPFTMSDISEPPEASVQSNYIKDVTHTF